MREGVFVPDLTRSGVRVRGLGLVWTSGPTRSDRDQHQTRSRTRHRNLTRLVSYVLLRCNAASAILYCAEAAVPEGIVRLYAVVTVTDLVIRPRGR